MEKFTGESTHNLLEDRERPETVSRFPTLALVGMFRTENRVPLPLRFGFGFWFQEDWLM